MTDPDPTILLFTSIRCSACRDVIVEYPGDFATTETISTSLAWDLIRSACQHAWRCTQRPEQT